VDLGEELFEEIPEIVDGEDARLDLEELPATSSLRQMT